MIKDSHVAARLPAELLEELEELARAAERTVSAELRVAIRERCERLRMVDVETVPSERTP